MFRVVGPAVGVSLSMERMAVMAAEARVLEDLALDVGTPSAGRKRPKLVSVAPPRPPRALEVESLPASGLGSLPAAFTVQMRAVDGSVFHLSTSSEGREGLAESGAIALDPEEWEALTIAVEADRAWPADLVQALRARGVTGRFSMEGLLDGITYEQATSGAPRAWTFGRVLARIGARIDDVWLESDGGTAFP